MTRSFTMSFVFHAALILAALFVLPKAPPFKVKEPVPIVVDISTIADKVQQAATTTEKVAETPDPAPPESKVTKDVPPAPKIAPKVNTAAHEAAPPPPPPDPTPPPPKPAPPPPPKPAPPPPPAPTLKADDEKAMSDLLAQQQADEQKKLDEQKRLEEKKAAEAKKLADAKAAEEKKQAEAKAAAEAKKLADDKKKKLDDALAQAQAQLNKISGDAAAPPKASDKKGTPKHADKVAMGSDANATATIVSALVSKMKGCFDIPPAALEKNVSVPIHFMLNQDGSVRGRPEIVGPITDPVEEATARAAISAVMGCQPYALPADQYDLWKDNVLDFNPTQLSG